MCAFCNEIDPVRINLNTLDLQVCPSCKASFLPAEQIPELRRVLVNTTKIHFIRVLEKHIKSYDKEILCMVHKVPLEKGEVPGFSYESLVPKCCSLQHLAPSVMVKVLKLGLDISEYEKRDRKGGLARFFGGFLFRLWEKHHPVEEDDIDRLQYNFKFKGVLEDYPLCQT